MDDKNTPVAWRIGHQFDGDRTVWTYFDGADEVDTDKAQPLYASPPKAVTVTDEMVTMVRELEEACNSARTALAGMTSVQSAIDKLDCRPLNVSHSLAALSSEAHNGRE